MPELIDVEEPIQGTPPPPRGPRAPSAWLRNPRYLSPRLRRLLQVPESVIDPEQLPPGLLLRPEEVTPLDLARPGIHFGMGLAQGAIATFRSVRAGAEVEPPEPSSMAQALGQGITRPFNPRDPLVAVGMAFPPGSAIERGVAQAITQGRQLAKPSIGLATQATRRAVAEAPGVPGAARLRIAGVRPVRGAAVPSQFRSEREAIEHLNGLLDDLDNVQAELGGLKGELAAGREMKPALRQRIGQLETQERNLETQAQEIIEQLQAPPRGPVSDVPGVVLQDMRRAETLAAQEVAREAADARSAAIAARPELYGFPPKPGAPPPVSGQPPLPPRVPPPPVPLGGPPAKPGEMTAEIAQRLLEAQAIVARDKGGTITNILDTIPGLRQALRYFVRARAMKDQTLVGWVAQGNTESVVRSGMNLLLRGQQRLIEAAFGKGATLPEKFRPAGVKFIGTDAQRAVNKAAGDLTGDLFDVLERPALYELSDAQRNAVRLVQEARGRGFEGAKTGYGLDITAYPTQPGGMHLAHVDKSDDAIKVAGSLEAALRRGRSDPRFYPTIADRMRADPTFDPVTSVLKLLMADDENLARMAGKQTFLLGSGGLRRLEVMEKVRPALASKMHDLKKRLDSLRGSLRRLDAKQAEAIDDFLASPLEETAGVRTDLTELQAALNPVISRGARKGKDIRALEAEIRAAKQELEALRPEWRTANLKPYAFVKEGAYRYYPAEEAEQVRRLMERSRSSFLRVLDELRATAFGGDLSPISIQGMILWLADPVQTSRLLGKGRALVSAQALEADMIKNPESWGRFTAFSSIDPLGGVGKEFATGYVAKVPVVGKLWERWNEDLYRPLVWGMKQQFDLSYASNLQRGLSAADAAAVAADDATKIVPRVNFRRLGWSEAEMARYRAVLTSVSFLTQPAALMSDATKGLLKLGLKQTLTPTERFAVQRVVTLAATVEALAVASNVWYAKEHNLDLEEAALESLNPASDKFTTLILPGGGKIPLGGPFRSLIRAIVPRKVDWSPVPVPFAGLERFAQAKIGPGLRVIYDELRDRDYSGEQIRTGQFPVNILQGLEYAFRGSLPLTAGEAMKGAREGMPGEELVTRVIGQFAGTNYAPESLTRLRERVAAEIYPIEPEKEPWRQREPYWGLKPAQREKVDAQPLVKLQIEGLKDYREASFEAVQATKTQLFDNFRATNEAAETAWADLDRRRAATAAGKMRGDKKALSPKGFREGIKDIARARRLAMVTAIAQFDEFVKKHPQKEYEELNPDALNRERFLAEWSNYEDLLDKSTGAWDYERRDGIRAYWEKIHGADTVRRWLKEGAEDTPPGVRRYYDGLEKYREYFTVRDVMLAGAPAKVRAWAKLIDEAEMEGAEPGVVERLKAKAPPELAELRARILKIKHGMRRDTKGRMAGLDRWLFDYGHTPSTLAEQEAREKR